MIDAVVFTPYPAPVVSVVVELFGGRLAFLYLRRRQTEVDEYRGWPQTVLLLHYDCIDAALSRFVRFLVALCSVASRAPNESNRIQSNPIQSSRVESIQSCVRARVDHSRFANAVP